MAERPILFSGPMVRAILAGHKTQTRRIIRLPPGYEHGEVYGYEGCYGGLHALACDPGPSRAIHCPYGSPGDRLWVRETWRTHETLSGLDGALYRADGGFQPIVDSKEAADAWVAVNSHEVPRKWRPSIHMPRWASRLTLEITDVRVERLQDITEEDARAEGVTPFEYIAPEQSLCDLSGRTQATHPRTLAFAALWDTINAERLLWVHNPWVWALSFRAVSP